MVRVTAATQEDRSDTRATVSIASADHHVATDRPRGDRLAAAVTAAVLQDITSHRGDAPVEQITGYRPQGECLKLRREPTPRQKEE